MVAHHSMLIAAVDYDALWRAVTYQLPFSSNTATVLRGTAILGLACGVVGSFLLLRKRSLIADALSHAALPGVAVGFLAAMWIGSAFNLSIDPKSLAVLIPAAAVFGVLGVGCVQLLTRIRRIKEDAAIGAVLSVFFAIGVVLLGVIQRSAGDSAGLNHFIFGQAATMTSFDANLIALIAIAVVIAAIVMHKELKTLCFDSEFAASLGWSRIALDGVLMAMVTTLTVIGLSAVGAVLMVALLIIPPAAARFWTNRLPVMLVLAAFIGAISCHIGTSLSAAIDRLPTGPAIVSVCGVVFVVSLIAAPQRGVLVALLRRWRLARVVARQHMLRAMYELEEIQGNADCPIPMHELTTRRSWSLPSLKREIRRAARRGEISSHDGSIALTESGREAAATIVRTHRIWEHFLTTQADIAPSHVDRAADDIEHVLSEELIRELEQDLRDRGALDAGEYVPHSAHRLAMREHS